MLICDLAFGSITDYADCLFKQLVAEQRHNYGRLPGKVVLHYKARVGERARESRYPSASCSDFWYSHQRNLRRGVIASIDCDHGTEIAVNWDDGTTSGYSIGGLKCGKKGGYGLVYY